MDNIFKEIVKIPALSGKEHQLMDYLDWHLRPHVDKIETDKIGNNIKTIGNGKTKIMITAHGDEVGFIVTYVDKEGYAYFKPLGGIKNDIAVGQRVNVLTNYGELPGIIGRDKKNEATKQSKSSDMWIDTGVTEKTNHVEVGDRAYFASYIDTLQDNCVLARGADNKAGVYATTQIIKEYSKKRNKDLTVYSVITSREEASMRGAEAVVETLRPSYALVIDTTYSTDTPGADVEGEGVIKLGKGPVISIGASTNDSLFKKIEKVAKDNKIPVQITAESKKTSTETDKIQSAAGGVISMAVYIPVRYMHTAGVLFNWKDVENTIQLVTNLLIDFKE